MLPNWVFWVVFNAFVVLMLVLDLGVFHRRSHAIRFKEAIAWTFVWVALAGLFALLVHQFGHHMVPNPTRPNSELALEFVTGYLIEESLSMDNLFVFLLIFRYFAVDRAHQHTVLFWGILGALVMRAAFIVAGVTLINRLHWIIYLFGAFLVYTGFRLFRQQEAEIHPEQNQVLKLFRRLIPVSSQYEGRKFFVKQGMRWLATPLRSVHCLHLQRICHSGTALPLLRAGGNDGGLPLPALRAGGDFDLHRGEDAELGICSGSHRYRADVRGSSARDLSACVAAVPGKARIVIFVVSGKGRRRGHHL